MLKVFWLVWLTTRAANGCVALVEHATKGKKHAEKTALHHYLPDIKLKIMLNDYELLFSILIWMFYYLFGWEMRHLHTGGSCPVVSGQGGCDYYQFWSLAGRAAQCCGRYAQFFVLILCNLICIFFFQLLQTTTKNAYKFVCYEIFRAGNFRPGPATFESC